MRTRPEEKTNKTRRNAPAWSPTHMAPLADPLECTFSKRLLMGHLSCESSRAGQVVFTIADGLQPNSNDKSDFLIDINHQGMDRALV